jgi:hypothetical protein
MLKLPSDFCQSFKQVSLCLSIILIYHLAMICNLPIQFLYAKDSLQLTSIDQPLPEDHIPPTLYLYQPQDYSALFDLDQDQKKQIRKQWDQVILELQNKGNLKIITIDSLKSDLKKNPQFTQNLNQAQFLTRQGVQSYREVELEKAMLFFEQALIAYRSIDYALIEPQEVAQVYLEIAFCAIELANEIKADQAFREALIHHPKIKLKVGIDGEKAIKIFNQTVQRLKTELQDETTRHMILLSLEGNLFNPIKNAYHLKSILIPSGFYTQLSSQAGLKSIEVTLNPNQTPHQNLEQTDIGSRLASKIWHCLPFQIGKRTKSSSQLPFELYGGMHYFSYLEAPTNLFSNVGTDFRFVLTSRQRVSLDLHVSWANSNRDSQEHLRQDLTSWRIAILPKIALYKNTRIMINLSLGLELNHLNAIKLTREVGCKYFEPSPQIPNEICLFNEDFQNFDASFNIGTRAQIEINIPLSSEAFRLAMILNATSYFVESNQNVLGLPVGGSLQLGYSFL